MSYTSSEDSSEAEVHDGSNMCKLTSDHGYFELNMKSLFYLHLSSTSF